MKNFSVIAEDIKDKYQALAAKINAIPDRLLLLYLSIFYFVWRILTLPMFEFSGDAAWKWRFLRYYLETGIWFPARPEHHQGRWCQNLPTYWLMNLFDSSAPWIGMIIPVLSGFLLLLLVWLITRSIASRMSAVLAWFSVLTCFTFTIESAQFLPSLPATMYTLLAVYIIILYLKKTTRWYLPLLAGFAMGLAWGCKVTSAYWCLGIGLFLMFFPVDGKNLLTIRKMRIGWDIILFTIGFLIVLIPETYLINEHFHVSMGRISMLREHHGVGLRREGVGLIAYLLSPIRFFLDVNGKAVDIIPVSMLFLLIIPPVVLQLLDKKLPLIQKFLAFTLTVAAFMQCYFVVQVFPFKHPERQLSRYFLTLTCVSFIILYSANKLLPSLKGKWDIFIRLIYSALFIALVIFVFAGWIKDPVINGDHLFNKIEAYRCMAEQKKNDLPVLVKYDNGKKYKNRTHKIIVAWKTFIGELSELPQIGKNKDDEFFKKWSSQPPVISADGTKYFYLMGKMPHPGASELCMVIDEEHVRLVDLSIAEQQEKELKK